ncbi:MAG: glycosyltransferase family 1 protein [Gammaproteobacteria bacterium]|nr:glycosyltransferase family 1 protein [Gammaproteobacteria bacterium]
MKNSHGNVQALKIAIFFPHKTAFYQYLLHAMCRGFEELGVEVTGHCGLLPEGELVNFCLNYKPNIVLEMNRARCDVQGLPKNVTHICWLVDLWEKSVDQYYGSEMIFFFDPTWKDYYPFESEFFCDYLPPGACTKNQGINRTENIKHDFSFSGHIPKPWNEDELNRKISFEGGPSLRFGELYQAVLTESAHASSCLPPSKAVARINRLIRRGCRVPRVKRLNKDNGLYQLVKYLHGTLYYDVNTRVVRMWGRQQLVQQAINISDSVGIYGTKNWADWEQYRKYYKGMVNNPEDLTSVYSGSRINLHQGVGMHFRVIDCMSVGGAVFVMRRQEKITNGEIGDYFEDGVHFVSFDIDSFAEKASEFLANKHKQQKIGKAAAEVIAASHTWRHRAEKIINDYRRL